MSYFRQHDLFGVYSLGDLLYIGEITEAFIGARAGGALPGDAGGGEADRDEGLHRRYVGDGLWRTPGESPSCDRYRGWEAILRSFRWIVLSIAATAI